MGRIVEKQRFECRECGALLNEPELLKAQSPFDNTYELTACPNCKQCDAGFDMLCDEIGCNSVAVCGWPTGNEEDEWGGYRNTCSNHMAKN